LGNWIADLLYTDFVESDVVILNSGTLRSNSVLEKGHLTLRHMSQLLPTDDRVV
jgi:hypothetical protein